MNPSHESFIVALVFFSLIILSLIATAVNEAMSKRAVHKAFYESAALIGASILQVYLLRRLFERKLGMSRV